jgi:hypothetical protein
VSLADAADEVNDSGGEEDGQQDPSSVAAMEDEEREKARGQRSGNAHQHRLRQGHGIAAGDRQATERSDEEASDGNEDEIENEAQVRSCLSVWGSSGAATGTETGPAAAESRWSTGPRVGTRARAARGPKWLRRRPSAPPPRS